MGHQIYSTLPMVDECTFRVNDETGEEEQCIDSRLRQDVRDFIHAKAASIWPEVGKCDGGIAWGFLGCRDVVELFLGIPHPEEHVWSRDIQIEAARLGEPDWAEAEALYKEGKVTDDVEGDETPLWVYKSARIFLEVCKHFQATLTYSY